MEMASRFDPELLDPSTSGPTVPYKYVTGPTMGFDDSGNFYILTEYSNAATAATSSSGAVVLQKYSFTGDVPSAQPFINNVTSPDPYGGGFGGGGFRRVRRSEGHLPVGRRD